MRSNWWIALAMGTILFALQSTGFAAKFKVIHTFQASTDGVVPEGALILDAKGNLYGTTVGGGLYGGGTVFELSPNSDGSWTETILYNFKYQGDGGLPNAALVFDAQGNLYGTTQQGGIFNSACSGTGCGVVFELTPGSGGWTETVLYSFTGLPDGAFPSGPVVLDAAGNLYGTTSGGGVDNQCFEGCGTAFELVKASGWAEQQLHVFQNYPFDGAYPLGGLTFDRTGNLFGTTEIGGLSGGFGADGIAYVLKPGSNGQWSEHILHTFCSRVYCGDGNGPEAGVILVNGSVLGTTSMGGGSGRYGVVFKLTPLAGKMTVSSYAFNTTDGADPVAPVLALGGKLFGVTAQGGIQNSACALYPSGNGVVFELAPQSGKLTETVLYSFTGGSDGCGPVGGLVADAAGNLYGTTNQGGGSANGGTVFEVTP